MGRPPKNIPKQQLLVKYAFQREPLGDLSFDIEKDHHRSLRYLLRNIKRVLRHHEKSLIRANASKLKVVDLGKTNGSSFSLSTRPSLSFGGGSSGASFADARKAAAEQDDDRQFPALSEYIKDHNVTIYIPPFTPKLELRMGQSELRLDIISLRPRSTPNGGSLLDSRRRQSSRCSISVSLFGRNAGCLDSITEQSRECTLIMDPSSTNIKVNLEQPFKFGSEVSQCSSHCMEIRLSPAGDDTAPWPPIPVTTVDTPSSLVEDPGVRIFPDGLHATYTDFLLPITARERVRVMYAAGGTVFKTQYNLELAIAWAAAPPQPSAQINLPPFEPRMTSHRSRTPGSAPRNIERSIATVADVAGVITSYIIASAQDQNFPTEVRRVNFTGFHCPLCLRVLSQTEFEDIETLRFHFVTSHPAHKVVLQEAKSSNRGRDITKYSFNVSAATQKEAKFASRWLAWVVPGTPFDVATYIEGDESWVGNRSIPDSKGSVLVVGSRLEALRHENNGFLPVQCIQDVPVRQRRKYAVPTTRTQNPLPLFTSITHRVLQPDEELSESDDETDETWVRDKHAQEILDVTHEPLESRKLQIRWNDHVRSEQISSAFYCNDVFLRWVKKEKEWLGSNEERMNFYHRFSRQLWEAGRISRGVATKCRAMIYQKEPAEKTETTVFVTEVNGT